VKEDCKLAYYSEHVGYWCSAHWMTREEAYLAVLDVRRLTRITVLGVFRKKEK